MQNKSAMMQQIESIPGLMTDIYEDLKNRSSELAVRLREKKFRKIILTGCGDSLCSAMAAKFAFLSFTGMEVEVTSAIDLARVYEKRHLAGNGDIMTVIVSNSGAVSRTIELAKRIQNMGGFVLSVTGKENSGLALHSDMVMKLTIPPFVYAPGIRSYCGCLCALYQIAVSMGECDGTLSREKAEDIRKEMEEIPEGISNYLPLWESQAKDYGERVHKAAGFELIGAGSQYATAWFGYAKALETTGKPSSALNTEDWFHMNYFIRDVYHTATLLIVNRTEGSMSRAAELIETAQDMGRPLLCITDSKSLKAREKIITPETGYEVLNALIQYLPVSMVFSYVGDLLGETYFRDGKDNWTACVDCATIVKSRETVLE